MSTFGTRRLGFCKMWGQSLAGGLALEGGGVPEGCFVRRGWVGLPLVVTGGLILVGFWWYATDWIVYMLATAL